MSYGGFLSWMAHLDDVLNLKYFHVFNARKVDYDDYHVLLHDI